MEFLLSFHYPLGLVSFMDQWSCSKQIQCMSSVISGIVLCVIAYNVTAFLSSLCFSDYYGKLTAAKKVEWNNRGFSTFHALFVAVVSFYLLVLSGTFDEQSQDKLIVSRSTLSDSILGISIGYFISDIAMILWTFPSLGGVEYVLHHGVSMYSITLSLLSGQAQIYILMVLFSEVTTPFVNLRWYLDVVGQKNSKLYIFNGIALFLGWLVARIILFIYFFTHMAIHFDQIKTIFPLGFYSLLIAPSVLAFMNVFWFWKIAKGLVKTLSKAKHSK